jgi:predicted Fe-Mo cluster-binding NifX family protein
LSCGSRVSDRTGTVSPHFGEASFFALVTVHRDEGDIEEQRILANPYRTEEKKKGVLVAKWLLAHKIDVALVKQSLDGRGPGYVLRDAGVVLRESGKETLAEAIASQRSVLGGCGPVTLHAVTPNVRLCELPIDRPIRKCRIEIALRSR